MSISKTERAAGHCHSRLAARVVRKSLPLSPAARVLRNCITQCFCPLRANSSDLNPLAVVCGEDGGHASEASEQSARSHNRDPGDSRKHGLGNEGRGSLQPLCVRRPVTGGTNSIDALGKKSQPHRRVGRVVASNESDALSNHSETRSPQRRRVDGARVEIAASTRRYGRAAARRSLPI